ncbi:YbaY family lipoprotein [Pseudomonas syringae]|nr:YbaY family lipoprotein [Pseudomonas syringae]MBD8575957.1 YbaY family lipoprotein [Pseudomonas syringae]MBD8792560.1 YbaY family lipoprotein [Pseudomonas syringae]MBD8802811.1 YbaY family lipoprotein [Pseudomonas syringae]MBD8813383.1 YbaY family lipoprotein [Pseudomonas syringae]
MKTLALITLAGLLSACSTMPTQMGRLDGEVFYLQRMALPPSATLDVTLQDISHADAPAVVLARQSGPIQGQVPLPFILRYRQDQVQPGHRYAVSARIESEGRLLFINTEQHTVALDADTPQSLRIRVNPARP